MGNFWDILLRGIFGFIVGYLGPALAPHVDWNLSAMFTSQMAVALVIMLTFVGEFVNLAMLSTAISVILTMEMVRAVLAVYKWIKGLNPVSG